jgi:hypothetical protein
MLASKVMQFQNSYILSDQEIDRKTRDSVGSKDSLSTSARTSQMLASEAIQFQISDSLSDQGTNRKKIGITWAVSMVFRLL